MPFQIRNNSYSGPANAPDLPLHRIMQFKPLDRPEAELYAPYDSLGDSANSDFGSTRVGKTIEIRIRGECVNKIVTFSKIEKVDSINIHKFIVLPIRQIKRMLATHPLSLNTNIFILH
jgi:hypothetical protein